MGADSSEMVVGTSVARERWREVLAACESSGQSISSYCRENNIVQSTYYYWRSVLKGKAVKPKGSPFVRVQVAEESSSGIRLQLGQGVYLQFDCEPNVSWLKELADKLSC